MAPRRSRHRAVGQGSPRFAESDACARTRLRRSDERHFHPARPLLRQGDLPAEHRQADRLARRELSRPEAPPDGLPAHGRSRRRRSGLGALKMSMARLTIAILVVLLCVTVAQSSAAGRPEPLGEVEDVSIYVRSPTNPRNALSLEIFPAEGVAVARTYYGPHFEPESGASYSVAIPVAPFDGSLDLDFPGLGEVTGEVTSTKTRGAAAEASFCEQRYPSESATFEGQIAF